uniref:McrB family protein n=1 Tax=Arthrobacter sp. TaxID=1667 RepID=UPI000EB728A9|nr:AAA family ATPase [Arthrobacter sp.]AXV46460.1 5-methylcytosine-specific restriction protein [Arthrobacter sp.]AXV46497.1 5-methylcytosine-specific restriction enzyme subunit McrB [Arthrobacter sp.]
MPPIESPGVVSLTKFFKVSEFVEFLKSLVPGVDTAKSVETKLEEVGSIKEIWNDLFTYEPKLEKPNRAAGQVLLDDELLRAARDDRPDAHLLVWCAQLLADSRLEMVVREHLTDSVGRIIPAMVNRNELQARLVQLAITTPDNPKPTTNILSYLETCKLLVLIRNGGSVTGVEHFLPTAYAVPGLLSLVRERARAWKSWFRPQDDEVLDFALSIGANHWLNLSRNEFRAAADPAGPATPPTSRDGLPAALSELRSQLIRKGQVVLQGPPGTGKTYLAKEYISWATGDRRDEGHLQRILDNMPLHERTVEGLADEILRRGLPAVWEIVQIHPSYEYTDFVRALVAEPVAGGVTFTPKHRVLSFMSALGEELARRGESTELILILDELNRGNIPAIFGELLYALEYRGEPVATPYSVDGSTSIAVPKSLQIIGTMNTADRSIAVIDYALRRRFVFLDVPATDAPIASNTGYMTDRAKRIALKLFAMVGELVSGTTIGIQVGPSYFMPNSSAKNEDEVIAGIAQSLIYEVLPLLSEYALEGEVEPDALDKFRSALGLKNLTSAIQSGAVIEKLLQIGTTTGAPEATEPETNAD